MHALLNPGGHLVGLLFNYEFNSDEPPYGGTEEEYRNIFNPYFYFKYFSTAYNSIKPRAGREIFLNLVKLWQKKIFTRLYVQIAKVHSG